MKIGVLSDTHDAMKLFRDTMDCLKDKGCEVLFHGGDFVSPFAFKILGQFTGQVYCVFGNNEGERVMIRQIEGQLDNIELEDEILTTEAGGKRILIKHRPDGVEHYARSGDFDYVFYGHTHKIDLRQEQDTRIINPGEVCGYLTGRSTAALLNTENDHVEIIDVM